MIKFKVFSGEVTRQYDLKRLESRVNDFLDTHEVINIITNFDSQKYESWFACAMTQILVYTIKYEDKETEHITKRST